MSVIEWRLSRITTHKKQADIFYEKIKLCEHLLDVLELYPEYREQIKQSLLEWSAEDIFLSHSIKYGKQLFGSTFHYQIEDYWKTTYHDRLFPCLIENCNRKFKNIEIALHHFCFQKIN